jgi:hypothetical protein
MIVAEPSPVQVLITPETVNGPPLLPPPPPMNRLQEPICWIQPILPDTATPVAQLKNVAFPVVQLNSKVSPVTGSCMLCVKFGKPTTVTL